MTCVDCENFYIKDHKSGVCHNDGCVYLRTHTECDDYVPRQKDIVPMLDYIASKISLLDLVLFEDGAPLFTIKKDMSVSEIEITLRCMCRNNHTYDIIDYKEV